MDKLRNILSDRELWFVMAFNCFLAWGYQDGWLSMDTLVWIYYFQSVLIGMGNTVRMACLKNFNTDNFTVNGEAVTPTPKTKWTSAIFFMFHYGFFHLGYFIFLAISTVGNGSKLDFRMVLINIAAIAANTVVSVWSNVLRDREEPPAISSLFFTPYLRVVPMHIFIMVGFNLKTEKVVSLPLLGVIDIFWIFLLLKTLSDILMHIVVQKSWRERRIKPLGGYV